MERIRSGEEGVLLNIKTEAGFEFEIDIPDKAMLIDIDRRLFARVIGNLLTNAANTTVRAEL